MAHDEDAHDEDGHDGDGDGMAHDEHEGVDGVDGHGP